MAGNLPKIPIDKNQLMIFDDNLEIKDAVVEHNTDATIWDNPMTEEEREAELRGGSYGLPDEDSRARMREILGTGRVTEEKVAVGASVNWAAKIKKSREIRKKTGKYVAPENIGLTREQRRSLR